MKYRLLGFIAILVLIVSSCTSGTEKIVESRFPDKSPEVVKYYKKNGEIRELVKEEAFYPNKKKRMEGEYKNNEREGRWIYYYEDGKVWSEGFFKQGKNEGKRITYFENGNKRYEGNYKEDLRAGLWKFYNEQGKLVNQIDYGKGVPENETNEK
jgi:antitoxin component YwqK of YwqJK toxin-antitoxin module